MTVKTCCRCKVEKPISDFYVRVRTLADAGKSYGWQSICKACGNSARRPSRPCVSCGKPCKGLGERCRDCNRGPQHHSWKGGTTTSPKGYVQELCPGHPRAGKRGYAPQHVLVMEKTLGRYLVPGESVHHKNGVRHDNRPENLELWIKAPTPGIRASDAVIWAREIIARYD